MAQPRRHGFEFKLPCQKLTSQNWLQWSFQVELLLVGEKLWDVVQPPQNAAGKAEAKRAAEQSEVEKCVLAFLAESVDAQLVPVVLGARKPEAAWLALREACGAGVGSKGREVAASERERQDGAGHILESRYTAGRSCEPPQGGEGNAAVAGNAAGAFAEPGSCMDAATCLCEEPGERPSVGSPLPIRGGAGKRPGDPMSSGGAVSSESSATPHSPKAARSCLRQKTKPSCAGSFKAGHLQQVEIRASELCGNAETSPVSMATERVASMEAVKVVGKSSCRGESVAVTTRENICRSPKEGGSEEIVALVTQECQQQSFLTVIIDSGASNSLVPSPGLLRNCRTVKTEKFVTIADGSRKRLTETGLFFCPFLKHEVKAYAVPGLTNCLLSVHDLLIDGFHVSFAGDK
ncbi:---NA--- [Podarcis lilfordi]|uniref:---NA n=1 Tax=Podarcis lilfordi TaxID=74358 RepID=A0AA35JSU8_9SAUR|nr:---NA--- [Podarcis lilfordi]